MFITPTCGTKYKKTFKTHKHKFTHFIERDRDRDRERERERERKKEKRERAF